MLNSSEHQALSAWAGTRPPAAAKPSAPAGPRLAIKTTSTLARDLRSHAVTEGSPGRFSDRSNEWAAHAAARRAVRELIDDDPGRRQWWFQLVLPAPTQTAA